MNISIFLSYPRPYNNDQLDFITKLSNSLAERGMEPRTLGVTDYDMDAPLKAIRRLMLESNGLLAVAFKRTHIKEGYSCHNIIISDDQKSEMKINDDDLKKVNLNEKWITSPYCHIEPAMAFQLGLPVLILREKGVLDDGILEKGVLGTYMPEFDLDSKIKINDYFKTQEFKDIIGKWECCVRNVSNKKGMPPQLF